MTEREQLTGLPLHRTAYSFAELAAPNLIVNYKGIDIFKSHNRSAGDSYEEEAFIEITKRKQGLIGVGPHMLDQALGKCTLSGEASLSGQVRPDALLLSRNFCLMEMVEFKAGKSNGLGRKVDGFSTLLEKFRCDPDLLPDLLNQVLDENLRLEALGAFVDDYESLKDLRFPRIHIPDDSQIIARFVSPYPRNPITDGTYPFKVRFNAIGRQN